MLSKLQPNRRLKKLLIIAVIILSAATYIVFNSKTALADQPGICKASTRVPETNCGRFDPSDLADPDSGTAVTTYYDVGNNPGIYDFSEFYLNVYVNTKTGGSFTVVIENARADCVLVNNGGIVGPDYTQNGIWPMSSYSIVGKAGWPGKAVSPDQVRAGTSRCGEYDMPTVKVDPATAIPIDTGAPLVHYNARYILKVKISGSGQGENSFRVRIKGSTPSNLPLVGGIGGTGKYAGFGYRDTNISDSPYHFWNSKMVFAPVQECSDLSDPDKPKTGHIYWRDLDLDQYGNNRPNRPVLALYSQKVNPDGSVGSWVRIEQRSWNKGNITEEGVFAKDTFFVGYRYMVTMQNFGTRNTVFLDMDGQIEQIRANIGERPTIGNCYRATCDVTTSATGYKAGDSIDLKIRVTNTALAKNLGAGVVRDGATWVTSGKDILRRTQPTPNKTWTPGSAVSPNESITFTDRIVVPNGQTVYRYKMYTNFGARLMPAENNVCDIPIEPGYEPPPDRDDCEINPDACKQAILRVNCSTLDVYAVKVYSKWHPGGPADPAAETITQVPVAVRITSQDDSPDPFTSHTYVFPGGLPNNGGGSVNTFTMWPGGMWPHGHYKFELYVQGEFDVAPADSRDYANNGTWGPAGNGVAPGGPAYYSVDPAQPSATAELSGCFKVECNPGADEDSEPGQTKEITVGVRVTNRANVEYSSTDLGGYNLGVNTGSGLSGAPPRPAPTSSPILANSTTPVNVTFTVQINYEGEYSVTFYFRNEALDPTPCPPNKATTSTRPYFQVQQGDTRAGGGFRSGTVCPKDFPGYISPAVVPADEGEQAIHGDNSGGIAAFADLSLIPPGSLTEFGAFALGLIAQFPASKVDFGADVFFANQPTGSKGFLNAVPKDAYCVPDYFELTKKTAPSPGPFSVDGSGFASLATNVGGASGQYIANVDISNLGGPAWTVAPSQKVTLYVDGDVTIASNISYSGGWNAENQEEIPYFALIVRGNIFISNTVNRLDGLYIAQPRTDNYKNSGIFNTCAESESSQPRICNKSLLVNGAVIAQHVQLKRSAGTLQKTATVIDCKDSVPGGSQLDNCPAEVFIFVPSVMIGLPNFAGPGITPLEGILSLPPVF